MGWLGGSGGGEGFGGSHICCLKLEYLGDGLIGMLSLTQFLTLVLNFSLFASFFNLLFNLLKMFTPWNTNPSLAIDKGCSG